MGSRVRVSKLWTVSIVTFLVATVCCTNDAELGEFPARSSNVSMEKYTSKDGGTTGGGKDPTGAHQGQ